MSKNTRKLEAASAVILPGFQVSQKSPAGNAGDQGCGKRAHPPGYSTGLTGRGTVNRRSRLWVIKVTLIPTWPVFTQDTGENPCPWRMKSEKLGKTWKILKIDSVLNIPPLFHRIQIKVITVLLRVRRKAGLLNELEICVFNTRWQNGINGGRYWNSSPRLNW